MVFASLPVHIRKAALNHILLMGMGLQETRTLSDIDDLSLHEVRRRIKELEHGLPHAFSKLPNGKIDTLNIWGDEETKRKLIPLYLREISLNRFFNR